MKWETPMNGRKIAVTPSAYSYPLLIKQLLHAPLAQTARQEIVYRDVRRLTYLELRDRIGRLASALQKIGVQPGDSVGVLDWDSNRFLEAFFAIPMMGVVLQTVNVRLSPEQVAYTIDGFVRRNAHGVSAMLASGHEQPVPVFQQLARSDPSGRNDVRAVPTVAAKRRGSLGRARDRRQP
jgi:fatty-acyl-CoA synthase